MAAASTKKYYARRAFDYGPQSLDRGQVFTLGDYPNNERLIRLGYIAEVPRGSDTYICELDGAEFIGEAERRAHGDKITKRAALDPDEQDRFDEREERIANQVAPLYLDKTAATA